MTDSHELVDPYASVRYDVRSQLAAWFAGLTASHGYDPS